MYRFRKVRHLIEYGELENQEIFFSDIASLNDPMEGYRQFFWKGDEILWKNQLRHYLLCLEATITLTKLSSGQKDFTAEDIPVFWSEEQLPAQEYRDMIHDIKTLFFSNSGMDDLIRFLSSLQDGLNRDEVYFVLRLLHVLALDAILKIHVQRNLQPPPATTFPPSDDMLTKLLPLWKAAHQEAKGPETFATLARVFNHILEDRDLTFARMEKAANGSFKRYFIFNEFPSAYLKQIEKLTYPDSYVACFMDNCTNPVVWAHYGDSHKGVALKFKNTVRSGHNVLTLYGIVGTSGADRQIYEKRPFPLKHVNYSSAFPKQNFFASLGRLTVGQLMNQWFTDETGIRSAMAEILDDSKSNWKQDYWEKYMQSFLIKLPDWAYEKESRVILTDILGLHSEKVARKLSYEFSDLESIVFGMKTSVPMKMQIIEVIQEKCRKQNRSDFKFFQAVFNESSKQMEIGEIHGL
ncbi:MAG: DUF2971 domain-containing protein [Spirochaetia bacterium]|nr:DUF2971 domain-containing protein [Spirochaetia bacterium]